MRARTFPSRTQTPLHSMTNGEAEKKKDYRRAVLLQILFLTASLLAADTLRLFHIEAGGFLFDTVFHGLAGIYLVALCDMLRNYTDSKLVVSVSFGLLGVAFLILVAVNLIFSPSLDAAGLWRMVAHGILALIQLEVIAFAIRDLFRSRIRAADRLWGTACIYFMSGFAFASIYATILLMRPNAFGVPLDQEAYTYFETVYLSFNALVGLDTSYPQATRLVRNLCLVEGLWSQLYMVLLIGRLLTPGEGGVSSQDSGTV